MSVTELKSAKSGASTFVHSELFERTFREGMELVELTANYLDGEGRERSKELGRDSALAYASISMRLTTQLMQIASWLLVLRAVREGEMAITEAAESKYRLGECEEVKTDLRADGMPESLIGLVEETRQLYMRIARLDESLFKFGERKESQTDAAGQQRALFDAFGQAG
ncbi:MAG: hypothetical protein DHS20C05_23740 [Hyphococcus sp.]|nr:MAG: hypothetical protein DHS20C05_23740 [Marinicaulis sp.]